MLVPVAQRLGTSYELPLRTRPRFLFDLRPIRPSSLVLLIQSADPIADIPSFRSHPVLVSPGTRGATSAEYFLSASYAVLFLHRQHSLLPFTRHYSHSTHPFLDLLQLSPSSPSDPSSEQTITVDPAAAAHLLPILKRHLAVKEEGTLLSVPFVTVNEYLWLLRGVSEEMGAVGREGLFYLAAAVSDFFLPGTRMVSSVSLALSSHPCREPGLTYPTPPACLSQSTRSNPGLLP